MSEEAKQEEDEMATMQTQDSTDLMSIYAFLVDDEIDVNFIQECKLTDADMNKAKHLFKEKEYDLTCGPSNCETKKPRAGVGCAS